MRDSSPLQGTAIHHHDHHHETPPSPGRQATDHDQRQLGRPAGRTTAERAGREAAGRRPSGEATASGPS
ncbi:hypothetical protein [Streptomyces sp. x-19]|uniref:hypothetical protein n=1 Tax=Streptomyces sp. x-19 TaxID=2789280 RepID=UPI00397FEF90